MKLSVPHKNTRSAQNPKKGFTLIEVIVVMAIILGLAGIGFGVFFTMGKRAKEGETETMINAVAAAMTARSADISADQRATVGVQAGFTFPKGDGGDNSTKDLVSYISGDFDGDGEIDEGVKTKEPRIDPAEFGKNTFLDKNGKIVDSWDTPIRYTFPGDYHNEDDGFDLRSAGPDRIFDNEDDIILK